MPAPTPMPAATNDSSPICAMVRPVITAAGTPRPVKNTPIDTATILPITTTAHRTTISSHAPTIASGSINMPTDTKKIAVNRSRIGSTSGSIAAFSPALGDQRPGEERAQRDRVASGVRQDRQREAQPDRRHQGGLAPPQSHRRAHQARHDQEPARHRREQEPKQLAQGLGELVPRQPGAATKRGQDREQQDRQQVLDHQQAEQPAALGRGRRGDHRGRAR
jgi:hypothetical protein